MLALDVTGVFDLAATLTGAFDLAATLTGTLDCACVCARLWLSWFCCGAAAAGMAAAPTRAAIAIGRSERDIMFWPFG